MLIQKKLKSTVATADQQATAASCLDGAETAPLLLRVGAVSKDMSSAVSGNKLAVTDPLGALVIKAK